MKKFKTVTGRISYSDEWDVKVEKELEALREMKAKVSDYKVSISDHMIVAVFEYELPEPKKKNVRQAASA